MANDFFLGRVAFGTQSILQRVFDDLRKEAPFDSDRWFRNDFSVFYNFVRDNPLLLFRIMVENGINREGVKFPKQTEEDFLNQLISEMKLRKGPLGRAPVTNTADLERELDRQANVYTYLSDRLNIILNCKMPYHNAPNFDAVCNRLMASYPRNQLLELCVSYGQAIRRTNKDIEKVRARIHASPAPKPGDPPKELGRTVPDGPSADISVLELELLAARKARDAASGAFEKVRQQVLAIFGGVMPEIGSEFFRSCCKKNKISAGRGADLLSEYRRLEREKSEAVENFIMAQMRLDRLGSPAHRNGTRPPVQIIRRTRPR